MSLRIEVATPVDVARLIDGLLLAASIADEAGAPLLCKAWTDLADAIGDALDRLPTSSNARVRTALARKHLADYLAAETVVVNGVPRPKVPA